MTSSNSSFRSVRWPFRVLAGLILLVSALAAVVYCLAIWNGALGDPSIAHAIYLPAFAWFYNLCYSAAANGAAPDNATWPFASESVFNTYMILILLSTLA